MEMKAQEKELGTPGSLSYGGHLIGGSLEVERRRDGFHGGSGTTSRNRTQPLAPQQHHPSQARVTVTVPDPVTSATIAPMLGRSNSNPQSAAAAVRYRECLRNHAASTGGNVFDGCGEFMPSGEEGSLEALKCAACDCHRNFHRKEVNGETQFSPGSRRSMVLSPLQIPPLSSPAGVLHHQKFSMGFHTNPTAPIVQPMNVAYGGGGGGTESSSEDLNAFHSNADATLQPPFTVSKKRFRTKFTPEQKDKMLEFAEKVGWRIQKQDEEEVVKLCAEIGVKRQVLKVWMHNNKNSMKKPNETERQTFEMGNAKPVAVEGGIEAEM